MAAAITIYSNQVTVNVTGYSLTLTAPSTVIQYTNVAFSGYLNYTDGTPISGKTIYLYNATTNAPIGLTDVTDANGYYEIVWNATVVGSLDFKTMASM